MLYLVPSRGRPHNIAELIAAWEATRSEARMWVCVDDDDPTLDAYEALKMPDWVALSIAERMRLGGTLNYWSNVALHDPRLHPMIGFMGDDHRPRTANWDLAILEAASAAGGTAVVYGNDLLQGPNMATAVAMTTNIPEALGYMVPLGMTHLYMDSAWLDMGRVAGNLIYRSDVIIEHMHPVAKKAEWDDGYAEVNSDEMYHNDKIVYNAWLAEQGVHKGWRKRLRALKVSA